MICKRDRNLRGVIAWLIQQLIFILSNCNIHPCGVTGILHTPMGKVDLRSTLVGSFNVANLLAAIATALHLGIELE
jgi:UDP-N-acetylmuramoyl-L-alanyl-D-glutamate--2,6-diaminopimelate ligase